MHPQVSWILSRQAALTIVLGVLAWAIFSVNAAISVLIGGSIGVIANLGYVLRAMRMNAGLDPVKAYRAQTAGEFKFLLTLIGFALVFLKFKEVAVLPLFLGYASETFVIYWMALLKQR